MSEPLFSFEQVAGICDHTNLSLKAKPEDISRLCSEAREYHTASVCIRPEFVKYSAQQLEGSGVLVCSVVGFPDNKHPSVSPGSLYFPNGYPSTAEKVAETNHAASQGASEIDVVANNALLLEGSFKEYERDLHHVIIAAHAQGASVKVIFENCFLFQKEFAYKLAVGVGADYLKTSTGMGPYGAIEADLMLMRKNAGDYAGIKAAGGVSLSNYEAMILAMLGMTREEIAPGFKLDKKKIRIGESSLLKGLRS